MVFPSPAGVIWRPDNFRNRVFYKARERAGFDELTFHDLRHTCASLMIAAGANPLEIAEQLGHMDAQLVFKRYGHLYPGASRRKPRCYSMTLIGAVEGVGEAWAKATAPRLTTRAKYAANEDGACRDRTGDLRLAKPALSQLS